MSLLLDARKKTLQARTTQQEGDPSSGQSRKAADTAATGHEDEARTAGQNLFAAKSSLSFERKLGRNLVYGLTGTILLLASAAYLWLGGPQEENSAQPHVSKSASPGTSIPPEPVTPIDEPAMSDDGQEMQPAASPGESMPSPATQPRESLPASPVRIEHQRHEQIEPLLRDAYQAYSSGKLDEAQQLYLEMHRKDAQNSDALLGLAAIAQQWGEAGRAAQYYASVLALDPRNAAANAGLSASSRDDGTDESRLKLLLREQGSSAILHFALGNLYAEQSRWGEAQQAYFDAYTLEPGNAGFAYNLAVSLDHLGQTGLAAQYYLRSLQLDSLKSAGFDHAHVSRRIEELGR